MKKGLHKILIENICIHSNHGCLEEEKRIGSDYIVDLEIHADLSESAVTDELKDTIDYVTLNQIIQFEMKIRSKLLEHVAQRIMNRIEKELPKVEFAKIRVTKLNPPMGGNVEKVSVEFEQKFN